MRGRVCSVDGCVSLVEGLGFCAKHYQRFKKYGNVNTVKKKHKKIVVYGIKYESIKDACEANGVSSTGFHYHISKGKCADVAMSDAKAGAKKGRGGNFKPITISGISYKSYKDAASALGVSYNCLVHRVARNKKGKDLIKKQRNPSRACRVGDTSQTNHGYITEKISKSDEAKYPSLVFGSGWCMQHRIVMARYLDRDLLDGENVHHINGNRADNRIENLELWSSSQPSGQRVKDKIQWAKEILETYEGISL